MKITYKIGSLPNFNKTKEDEEIQALESLQRQAFKEYKSPGVDKNQIKRDLTTITLRLYDLNGLSDFKQKFNINNFLKSVSS